MSKAIGTGARETACGRALARWAGLIAALVMAVPALVMAAPALADTGTPAGNEVIGYATADRGGASATWTLADGAPYLFIPYVGPEVAGSVAAVDTGAKVGAVLFRRPYFGGHDTGCTPELGSNARPDLKWRGATAQFSPPAEAPASGTAATKSDRFASLIVYRKELGPPPGALLLNRRLTLGSRCLQAVHKTLFDRVFVPLAAPPEPARCYNLAGTYPQTGGKDIKVDFASADRLVLLQPADLDDRYRGVRHRFRVTLYDGEGCRGGGGEFRSEGKEPGDIKLDAVGLRDQVRSVRIVYEGGPIAPYYAVPAAVPVATAPPVKAKPRVAAKSPPPQPETPAPAAAKAPTPKAASPEAPTSEAPTSEAPTPEAPSPEAVSAEAAPAKEKVIAAPAPPSKPEPIPATPPDDVVVAVATPPQAPEISDKTMAPPSASALPLLAALPAPRLKLPTAKPAAPGPAVESKTFEYPVHEIYRLNFCLRWGVDCGEPAATAWCKAQGFAKASSWRVDKDIGSLFPTIVLADKRICAQFPCDGFEEITCRN